MSHYTSAAEMVAFLETERDVPQAEVWAGLASAQVHATLAVQEETEVVAEQLRRLADVAEAMLLLLQPLADRVNDRDIEPGSRERPRCGTCNHVLGCHYDDGKCTACESDLGGPCREGVAPPLMDDRVVCGAELHPGSDNGITCIRYVGGDEHADGFHDDGRGNRW